MPSEPRRGDDHRGGLPNRYRKAPPEVDQEGLYCCRPYATLSAACPQWRGLVDGSLPPRTFRWCLRLTLCCLPGVLFSGAGGPLRATPGARVCIVLASAFGHGKRLLTTVRHYREAARVRPRDTSCAPPGRPTAMQKHPARDEPDLLISSVRSVEPDRPGSRRMAVAIELESRHMNGITGPMLRSRAAERLALLSYPLSPTAAPPRLE